MDHRRSLFRRPSLLLGADANRPSATERPRQSPQTNAAIPASTESPLLDAERLRRPRVTPPAVASSSDLRSSGAALCCPNRDPPIWRRA
jgi:hypothetical protein